MLETIEDRWMTDKTIELGFVKYHDLSCLAVQLFDSSFGIGK